MDTIEVITTTTYIFFVYLLIALFVERSIEVLVAVFDYCECRFHWERFWNWKADHYEERFNRLYAYSGERDQKKKNLFDWILWKEIVDRPYPGGKDIVSADLIRINYMKVASRVVAFAISLAVVLTQWTTVDIAYIAKAALGDARMLTAMKEVVNTLLEWKAFRVILTAALLTAGSEPLHELIKKVERHIDSKSKALAGGEQ